MSTPFVIALVVVAWTLLPLPLAVAVGRAMRAGTLVAPAGDADAVRPDLTLA